MLCTLSSLSYSKAILLMSGFVVELVVHIQFCSDDVDFPYVLLDIEDTLGVECLVVHSLVVRSGYSQRCLPYRCCELVVEQFFFSSFCCCSSCW